MTTPQTTEVNDWEKFMAINANNLTWALTTKTRTSEEDEDMLNAAHAAAYHWKKVGTDLNYARAEMLLAEVHGLLGYGETALGYAQSVAEFFKGKDIPTWERAFVAIILARAYKALKDTTNFQTYLAEAQDIIASIEDDGDREVVEASMPSLLA
jgi:hypothetical protein